jgi:hypothetical protein
MRGEMDIPETVQKVSQKVAVPDLGKIKDENNKILETEWLCEIEEKGTWFCQI